MQSNLYENDLHGDVSRHFRQGSEKFCTSELLPKCNRFLFPCINDVSVLVLVLEVFPQLPLPFGILSLLISAIVVQ